MDSFNKLNFKGEEEALKRVRELTFVPEYTSDKEELWKLIPGSIKTLENPIDYESCSQNETTIAKETFIAKASELFPNAAHSRTDISESEKTANLRQLGEDIMDDENF